jgi:hypothetical protein
MQANIKHHIDNCPKGMQVFLPTGRREEKTVCECLRASAVKKYASVIQDLSQMHDFNI